MSGDSICIKLVLDKEYLKSFEYGDTNDTKKDTKDTKDFIFKMKPRTS